MDIISPDYHPFVDQVTWRYLVNDPSASSGRFSDQTFSTINLKKQEDERAHVADFDGDGAHDLLDYNGAGDFRRIWFEDGLLKNADYSGPTLHDAVMADVNGDGLKDAVRVAPVEGVEMQDNEVIYTFGPAEVHFNTGNGFRSPPLSCLSDSSLPRSRSRERSRLTSTMTAAMTCSFSLPSWKKKGRTMSCGSLLATG